MNSTEYSQYKIIDPNTPPAERAQLCCQLAKQREEIGEYEEAREILGNLWHGIGELPDLEGLDPLTAGEVLLRVGTLTGWIGSTRQIEGSQEKAKDLISQSIAIFETLNDHRKIAEAQIELGYCYCRAGALDDARIVFSEALSRLHDQDGDVKALALLRSALVEALANRLNAALSILSNAAHLFEISTNHTLKGRFHNELATVLKNLGHAENRADYVDRALLEYAAASFHFEQAGHVRYHACVENNLGMLFLRLKKLLDAHEHLDRAHTLFTSIGDIVHLAQVKETKARALLAEGLNKRAAETAQAAVQLLENGDEQSLLAEALTTYGLALAVIHSRGPAKVAFERAIDVAEQAGDLETAGTAALTLIEQLGKRLSDDELYMFVERAYVLLEDTENTILLRRHRECYRGYISRISTFQPNWTNYSLDRSLHRYEGRQIRRALEDSSGIVSQAARKLGLTHQRLHNMINGRHNSLRELIKELKERNRGNALNDQATGGSIRDGNTEIGSVRILHVEDDQMVASTVRETLEIQGWQVETCSNGDAALQTISSDAHYDLLLIDYDLAGTVNGIELVYRARKLAHRSHTPILVLAAAPMKTESLEAGANDFLQKPEGVSSLVDTIMHLLVHSDREVRED